VGTDLGNWLFLVSPSLVLFAGAMFLILFEAIVRPQNQGSLRLLAMLLTGVAMLLTVGLWGRADQAQELFYGMLRFDHYGLGFQGVGLLAGFFALLVSHEYLEALEIRVGEYYALVLFGLFGMNLMALANDLMMVFISIEVMSLSMYILCAIKRSDPRSVESGFKYFILGAFASGLLLYGIALLYGASGSTSLPALAHTLAAGSPGPLVMVGGALVLAGFGFKVGAVPFHMYVPDVYQGAPTAVTSLMSTGVKAASFAALGRIILGYMGAGAGNWEGALWFMAAATMLIGNLGALVQNDLKRILAYSSIAHAGYMLMTLAAVGGEGAAGREALGGLLFYALTYTIMSAGTFAILTLLVKDGSDDTDISRLSGLGHSNPWLAAGMSICLLSLAGIPPTMGFVGKFYLFAATVQSGYTGLAIVGALSAAVGVYYYLRPMVYMYMREGHPHIHPNIWVSGSVIIACVLMFALGIAPNEVLHWAEAAVRTVIVG
jgi:NADH-quinone oxidoreductase subunit N